MSTILESLRGISAYPIPLRSIESVAEHRGLYLGDEATKDILLSSAYNLAKSDLMTWLSIAPDVSQGGISYSFTDEQRLQFRVQAGALLSEYAGAKQRKSIYGYKGSRL